jgi:PAS domain S-box-containing protein
MNFINFMDYLLRENGEEKELPVYQQSPVGGADQLRLSLCAARAGSWDWDLTTGEIYSSYELCEALGLRSSDGHWLDHIHPDDRKLVQADLQRALDKHQDFEGEYCILRPDGSLCWMQSRGWVLYDRNGRPQRIIGLGLEITARKQREMEREELLAREMAAREAAEAANRAKDEFLALVSHELRSSLNTILGWSHILASKQTDAKVTKQAAEAIEVCARVQERLIEDLIDAARLRSGKLRLDVQPVELPIVVATALEMARPTAESKGVELCARFAPDEGRINGDPARLQQIVWNLLSNAIKFTPRGGHVELELRRDGETLSLIVRDTGRGIAPDFLPYIFDRFRQAPSADSRRSGGLGLGLALTRELVELHGGTIDAESLGEGLGATFIVRFPYPSRSTAGKSAAKARRLPHEPAKGLQAATCG